MRAMREFPIVTKLGGRDAVFRVLHAAEQRVETIHALRMWVARDSIPGDAQRILMAEADRLGIKYSAIDFDVFDDGVGANGEAA
jgi:hypothetical protein